MSHTKVHTVLSEFKRGTLRSGGGGRVTSRRQAIAIALSEARRAGARIPPPPQSHADETRAAVRESLRRRVSRSA